MSATIYERESLADRLLKEGLEPLSALAPLVPGRRGPLTRRTLARWCRKGLLEATNWGGVWHSSRKALARCLAGGVPERPALEIDPAAAADVLALLELCARRKRPCRP